MAQTMSIEYEDELLLDYLQFGTFSSGAVSKQTNITLPKTLNSENFVYYPPKSERASLPIVQEYIQQLGSLLTSYCLE
jgi:hypothetical protein